MRGTLEGFDIAVDLLVIIDGEGMTLTVHDKQSRQSAPPS